VKKTALIAGIALLVLLVCCGGGAALFSGQSAPHNPTPSPESTGPSAVAVKPAVAKSAIGVGEWLIGKDFPAGRYHTDGPGNDQMCYWQLTTKAGAQPGQSQFVSNDVPSGPAYVTLKVGEFFKTYGCKKWTRA
jgi:hypothetical protein